MKFLVTMILTCLFAFTAEAGITGYNGTTNLGVFSKVKCSTGITCTQVGDKFVQTIDIPGNGGQAVSSGQMTNFMAWKPSALTSGTSTTPSATVVYLNQIYIPANATLTGIKISNGATVGTNKYIVALFSSAGVKLANSALAGTLTAGPDVYQAIPFTATYAVTGPKIYWIALYVDGTTDRFRSVPAVGEYAGLSGSVTGQTFGTIVSLTVPTTFTADKGPVAFTY